MSSGRTVTQTTQFTPTIEENPMFSSWRDSRNLSGISQAYQPVNRSPRFAPSSPKTNLVDTLSASLQANCALSSFKQEKTFQSNNFQSLSSNVELHEVFEYLGLSKYTDVFMQQEVRFTVNLDIMTVITWPHVYLRFCRDILKNSILEGIQVEVSRQFQFE